MLLPALCSLKSMSAPDAQALQNSACTGSFCHMRIPHINTARSLPQKCLLTQLCCDILSNIYFPLDVCCLSRFKELLVLFQNSSSNWCLTSWNCLLYWRQLWFFWNKQIVYSWSLEFLTSVVSLWVFYVEHQIYLTKHGIIMSHSFHVIYQKTIQTALLHFLGNYRYWSEYNWDLAMRFILIHSSRLDISASVSWTEPSLL